MASVNATFPLQERTLCAKPFAPARTAFHAREIEIGAQNARGTPDSACGLLLPFETPSPDAPPALRRAG